MKSIIYYSIDCRMLQRFLDRVVVLLSRNNVAIGNIQGNIMPSNCHISLVIDIDVTWQKLSPDTADPNPTRIRLLLLLLLWQGIPCGGIFLSCRGVFWKYSG